MSLLDVRLVDRHAARVLNFDRIRPKARTTPHPATADAALIDSVRLANKIRALGLHDPDELQVMEQLVDGRLARFGGAEGG